MKKQIPSARHEAAIPAHAHRGGFARKLAEVTHIKLGNERFEPDGFVFELGRRRLTIYEVVVTHDIDAEKLGRIRVLRSFMRHLGWMLRPMVVAPDGSSYPMSMRDGRGVIPMRVLREAVRRLDRK